jgi:uncharacterized protein YciI
VRFDALTLVLLRRPAEPAQYDEDELGALQQRHLAHLREQREAGALVAAGPFRDQLDERLRGLCLYRLPHPEARRLAEQDPLVLAGRIELELVTWLVPAGEITFPRALGAIPSFEL